MVEDLAHIAPMLRRPTWLAAIIIGVFSQALPTAAAQCSPPVAGNPPCRVNYGAAWNHIAEYEDIPIPDDLGSRFDGYQFSVGVYVDEQGRIGCGFQPFIHRPGEAALHVSRRLLLRLTTPVCSSIKTWKFRPLVVHGQTGRLLSPIDFNIERLKFVLADIPPEGAPIKRH